jgi:diguanylate cyclase (GGDEF)-like protein
MRIRAKLTLHLVVQVLLLCVAVGALLQLAMAYRALEQAQQRRFDGHRLASELRQSVEESTRMARLYAVGRRPEHLRYFDEIVRARNGRAQRPAQYDPVYWDLVLGGVAQVQPDSAAPQSLIGRIAAAGFDAPELALLTESWRRAEELQQFEAEVLARIEPAESGARPINEQRWRQAVEQLHGTRHLQATAAVMAPQRRFMQQAQARLDAERERAGERASIAAWLAGTALAVLGLYALASAYDLDRSVRQPMAQFRDWALSVRGGRLDRRTRIAAKSEFGELSEVVDQMADSVERHLAELREEVQRRTRAEEVIQHLANHDALTGLPSLRLVQDRLDRALARAQREGKSVAVLFADLNDFKPINDAYGHEAGDTVLKAVAQRLSGGVRDADTVGRIGGDEFLVILPDVSAEADARQVRDKLDAVLREPIYLPTRKSLVSLSAAIGIALYPSMAGNAAALMRVADEDMYRIKAGQKGVRAGDEGSERGQR